jgi:hypothetical protein
MCLFLERIEARIWAHIKSLYWLFGPVHLVQRLLPEARLNLSEHSVESDPTSPSTHPEYNFRPKSMCFWRWWVTISMAILLDIGHHLQLFQTRSVRQLGLMQGSLLSHAWRRYMCGFGRVECQRFAIFRVWLPLYSSPIRQCIWGEALFGWTQEWDANRSRMPKSFPNSLTLVPTTRESE